MFFPTFCRSDGYPLAASTKMTVCLLLQNERDLELLPIASTFATAANEPLTLIEVIEGSRDATSELSQPTPEQIATGPLGLTIRDWIASCNPQVAGSKSADASLERSSCRRGLLPASSIVRLAT